jgi:serine protease Do
MRSLADFSTELEALVAKSAPAVVGVEHRNGHGSGVAVSADGYVVTNAHVVRGARGSLRVRLQDGEALRAELVGRDTATDLAVLRVDAKLAPLALADARRLRVGQLVLAIGNPLRFERSVSLGVVSAIDRSLPGLEGRLFEGLVQTDAAINPGNSGGPLVDAEGAVVGINTAVVPWAQGIGFAVPSSTASWITAVLIRDGEVRRPRIGIAARSESLSSALARSVGQPRGIRVHDVMDDTPAARAGLRPEDLVLRAGERPLWFIDDLHRVMVLGEAPELSLTVWRDERLRDFAVRPEHETAH